MPARRVVPPLKATVPAPVTVLPAMRLWVPPPNRRVAPLAMLKVPVSVPPFWRAMVPVLIVTVPVLLKEPP